MRLRGFGLAGFFLLMTSSGADAALPIFRKASPLPPVFPVAIDELGTRQNEIRRILQNPTLVARGPSEVFPCKPDQYFWFLDHPDRAVNAWRRLGAKCVAITDRGGGEYGWADNLGSEVRWETVYRNPNLRVWYAHGMVRATPMLPMVHVEVIVVLHHVERRDSGGPLCIEHHSDLFIHTDSKTAALFARLMGTSTHRLAEQGLGQLQMFFSALSWYVDRHPDQVDKLIN